MVLFSPPIVNESNPLTVLSSDHVQTCNVIPNSAAAITLVDTTGSPSFMGTFTLYISPEQSEGQRTVFCRVYSADGMVTTNQTTFSVLGNVCIYSWSISTVSVSKTLKKIIQNISLAIYTFDCCKRHYETNYRCEI